MALASAKVFFDFCPFLGSQIPFVHYAVKLSVVNPTIGVNVLLITEITAWEHKLPFVFEYPNPIALCGYLVLEGSYRFVNLSLDRRLVKETVVDAPLEHPPTIGNETYDDRRANVSNNNVFHTHNIPHLSDLSRFVIGILPHYQMVRPKPECCGDRRTCAYGILTVGTIYNPIRMDIGIQSLTDCRRLCLVN